MGDATNPPASVNLGDDVTWSCARGYKNGTGNSAVHQGTFTATCGDDGGSLTASDSCVQVGASMMLGVFVDAPVLMAAREAKSVLV